jgi:hypothetical protein
LPNSPPGNAALVAISAMIHSFSIALNHSGNTMPRIRMEMGNAQKEFGISHQLATTHA